MLNAIGARAEQKLTEGLQALGLVPDAVKLAGLLEFLSLLARWNRTYNLTAIDDPLEMVSRHLLDSLSIAPHLCGQRILDVGSGAGLPGIPLAIWFPEREFHLLDSNGKKIRFLFQAKVALALANVTVHQSRAEALDDPRGFDCVTSRAFASLADMIRVSGHLLAPDGCLLAMKAGLDEDEVAAVTTPYTIASRTQLEVPGISAERQLLKITRQRMAAQ
jgi:16S rRNA (guanine527-N7)-methyltransferase